MPSVGALRPQLPMIAPERGKLTKELVQLLSAQEWADINRILQQYGFSWGDIQTGNKRTYVKDMLYGEPVQKLEELASYFLPPATPKRMASRAR